MDYQLGPGPLQVDQSTIDEKIKGDIGIVENGDVATHAITKGYYVIWKGDLYIAKTDISSGTTLSAASSGNLTAKPSGLGADVAILNSKITTLYYTGTVNSLQTSLASLASSMSVGDFQNIKYTAGETLSPFKNADIYCGTFKRTGNNFWSVMLEDPEGLPIYGTYRNGTWRWEELALNSNTIKYMDITDTSPVNVNSKSGQTITVNNFVGCATRTNDVMPLPYMNNNIQYIKLVNFNDLSVLSGSATIRVWYR